MAHTGSPSCWATNTPITCRHTSGTPTPRISAIRFTYIQLDFLVRRLAEQAKADRSLLAQAPYAAAV